MTLEKLLSFTLISGGLWCGVMAIALKDKHFAVGSVATLMFGFATLMLVRDDQ